MLLSLLSSGESLLDESQSLCRRFSGDRPCFSSYCSASFCCAYSRSRTFSSFNSLSVPTLSNGSVATGSCCVASAAGCGLASPEVQTFSSTGADMDTLSRSKGAVRSKSNNERNRSGGPPRYEGRNRSIMTPPSVYCPRETAITSPSVEFGPVARAREQGAYLVKNTVNTPTQHLYLECVSKRRHFS